MTLVAGIDSSTQSCKVLVCDAATGKVVREGHASHPPGTEIAPAAWEIAAHGAIEAAGGLDGVDALAVGAQQHGMVCLDASGQVIRPALLWNDVRSADAARALVSELGGARAWARRRRRAAGRDHGGEIAVAGRPRAGARGPHRGGLSAARLVDVAAAR